MSNMADTVYSAIVRDVKGGRLYGEPQSGKFCGGLAACAELRHFMAPAMEK